MAAPSSTVWGSTVGSGYIQSRLGIYKSITTTATSATVEIQIWYWSRSSVTDQYNNLYYDISSTTGSAKTNRGNVSISTSYDTGSWETGNQKKLKTYTYSYTRKSTAIKRYLYAKLDTVEYAGGMPTVSTTFTVPALASYTVKYNSNGGTNAPASQTKYYDKTLTLRTGIPTRTGHNFTQWKSSEHSDGKVYYYKPGGTTDYNGSQTLYAQWSKKTYTIKYNGNGGSGAPASQTKTYGTNLTLSSTKPTRASKSTTDEEGVVTTISYKFLGWSTNPDAKSATWVAGGTYTSNSGTTLYAVWRESTSSVDTEFIVSYDANGGENAPSYQIKKKDVTLTLRTGKPTYYGYNFVNWKSVQGSTTYSFNPGDTTTYNGDQVMVAQWTPWSHTVTFNINGGTGSIPANFNKNTGTEQIISATIPTRTNYTFKYWCTSKDGNGFRYYPEGEYDHLQDGGTVTLYAIWSKNGVVITNTGKMKAKEFIEDSEMLGFSCFGEVYAKEFIEGSVVQLGENNFKFIEFIEN